MFQPLYVAATGLSAMEDEITAITNNLANAETVAFKKGNTDMESLFYVQKSFKDMLNDAMTEMSANPIDIEYGTGVRVAATPTDFSQGTIETTSNPLDLAIEGDGFFQYKMADGSPAYGRAGNLHIDSAGNLTDPNGHILEPGFVIPDGTTAVVVRSDGTVFVSINNSSDYTELGQIRMVRFTNAPGLKAIGQNLFQITESSGEALLGVPGEEGYGSVVQYALEKANVEIISEMMRMVTVQRVFDSVTKAVTTYEAMLTSLGKLKQS